MAEIMININDSVRVCLTEHGVAVLKSYWSRYGHTPKQKPDKDELYEFEIWELMHIFGDSIFDGAKPVIINNALYYTKEV